jgi:hypothetical protein
MKSFTLQRAIIDFDEGEYDNIVIEKPDMAIVSS